MGLVTDRKGLKYKPENGQSLADGSFYEIYMGESAPGSTEWNSLNLGYPLNLDESPEYGKNKIVFFINVSANGKLEKGNSTGTNTDWRGVTKDMPENEFYKKSGEKIQALARKLPFSDSVKAIQPMKRLMACIALHMPNNLANTYQVRWQEEDMFTANAVADTATSIMGLIPGMSANGPGAWETAKGLGARQLIGGASYLEKATRMTPGNAKEEQLFKGVDFRTFSYDYDFSPKSETEAKAVLDIIRMFKYHMLPEFFDETSYMFIYPQEFEIKYYHGDAENNYLEKQMTAVLTNCTVNYTPNGQFNTFANGMPTQIRLQLQFKELGLLTKKTSPYDRQGL